MLGPRVRGRLALRPMLPFLGVGVLFGLSYVSLFEAYYRGRVTVVSPIVATESLWGVAAVDRSSSATPSSSGAAC